MKGLKMKKLSLLFLLMLIFVSKSYAFTFDFKLKGYDGITKDCKAFETGYVCNGEDPLYLDTFPVYEHEKPISWDTFQSLFIPTKEVMTTTIYASDGYKTCKQLRNGYYCKSELPVLNTSSLSTLLLNGIVFKKNKGILVKSDNGIEQICKVDKSGYICGDEKQKFNPILPYGTWEFYANNLNKENICTGYTNGYICPGKSPVYVDNFRSFFDFKLIYGQTEYKTEELDLTGSVPVLSELAINNRFTNLNKNKFKGVLITDKDNNQKICKLFSFDIYIQSGYVCKNEVPVVLKERPTLPASLKNASDYYVNRVNILTNESQKITCKQKNGYYYCPGEDKKKIYIPKRSDFDYNAYSEKQKMKQSLNGQIIKLPDGTRGKIDFFGDEIRIQKW